MTGKERYEETIRKVDEECDAILADIPERFGKWPYLIEGMLPGGQLHLLGGPSGGGKTTLAFQMLDCLTKGEPFLGRQTIPTRIAYVSGDRSTRSVQETQERCGVSFPIFSLVDENLVGEDLAQKVIPRLTAMVGHKPELVYVDGFTALVPGGFLNSYSVVAKWLAQLQRFCARMGITIVGACHTAKTKEGESFLDPRQRIAGSVAWAGFSETVLIIEPIWDDKTKLKRILHILPRNHQNEEMILKLDSQGRLTLPEKTAHAETITNFVMESVLQMYPPGTEILYGGLRQTAMDKGIQSRTFERWVAKYVEDGKLVKVKRGVYVIPRGSPESAQASEGEAPTSTTIQ